ncbi:hypothetical protein [Phaeobacter sp. HF9A]|uniref:hypothetical protein n=1 Tax=Phaeobacter sp. HF9A TaxID=2721561 RepID=UPI0014317F0F|nr:hypothetical protein [Phaeobacter sp. HF9A]NIZ14414.1 hypothetical protein [Phaeobacter sp. HF9A]
MFHRRLTLCLSLSAALLAPLAEAGTIEKACRSSARGAAQAALCHCLDQVAAQSLSRAEQRAVSKWFADPHGAEVVRQSANSRDAQLWKKYQSFGSEAERVCG